MSNEIVVSISAETDVVDERIPETSTPGFIDFSVSLDRPLVAGELAAVPLITSGTITASDIGGITATTAPGIRLQDAATTPTVLFEGAGAQVAALRLSFMDNSVLDGDKTATVALGDLRAPVVANPASATFSVTLRDDEYTFCFDNTRYDVSEGGVIQPLSEFEGLFGEDKQRVEVGGQFFDPALEVGIATATVVFARGGQPNVGSQEDVDVRFRYISDRATGVRGNQDTNDIDDVDYITSYEFPIFVKVPAGTPQYVLEFPIINDATIERTEIVRIASIPPRLPMGFIRCVTDFYIEDSTLVGITADSEAVPEGDTASFTLIPDTTAGGDFTMQLNVSETGGGDYVAASDEGMRSVDIRAGQTAVTFTVRTVADGIVRPDGQLRVEITDTGGYGNPNQAQDFPQSLFATLSVKHVSNNAVLNKIEVIAADNSVLHDFGMNLTTTATYAFVVPNVVGDEIDSVRLKATADHPDVALVVRADDDTADIGGTLTDRIYTGNPIALDDGETKLIKIVVTAEDGETTRGYTVRLTRAESADARLKSLTSAQGTVMQDGQDDRLYRVVLPNDIASVVIDMETEHKYATLSVSEGDDIIGDDAINARTITVAMDEGKVKELAVKVTAQNGTVSNYTLKVFRRSAVGLAEIRGSDIQVRGAVSVPGTYKSSTAADAMTTTTLVLIASKDDTDILGIDVDADGDGSAAAVSMLPELPDPPGRRRIDAGESFTTDPFAVSIGSVITINIRIGDAYVDETLATALTDADYVEDFYIVQVEQSSLFIRTKLFLEGPLRE